MNVQMVDLKHQFERLSDEIAPAIFDVLRSAHFIRGPVVDRFNDALAHYLGVPFAHGVGNGTDALQIAYMALGIGPGDEIITPSFTFIATAEAAALVGATVVFADIDPDTYNVDPNQLEQLITPATKAIVPVHLYGQAADMDPILEVAAKNDIAVIEDNAQAIGATYKSRRTGSLGTAATLSFFPSKNLGAFGDGGAVATRDRALHERMKMITNHGGRHKYYNEVVGVNSRLDAIQAAILEVKLRHLESFTAARRAAAARYDALLEGVDAITVPVEAYYGRHVYHQYTVRARDRDALAEHLRAAGIPCGIYYPVPLHRQPVFAQGKMRSGPMDESERAAREVLSLPMHTELNRAQQTYIVDTIRAFYRWKQPESSAAGADG